MSKWKLEQAERRIAELEAERDRLRAQIASHYAWADKVRLAVVGEDDGGCGCCVGCHWEDE